MKRHWRKCDRGVERKRGKCGSANSGMTQRLLNPMNHRDPKPVSSQLPGKWPDLSGQSRSSEGGWTQNTRGPGLSKDVHIQADE